MNKKNGSILKEKRYKNYSKRNITLKNNENEPSKLLIIIK